MKNPQPKTEYTRKNRIFYVRDYRHFRFSFRESAPFLLCCVLPALLCLVLLYDPLTRSLAQWAGRLYEGITGEAVGYGQAEFLPGLGNIWYVTATAPLPRFSHSLMVALLCLPAIILLSQSGYNMRPLAIFACMGLYVLLASALFSLFWPERFPYTLTEYSELYMTQTITLWIVITAIFGVAAVLLQADFLSRLLAFLCVIGYLLVLDITRYVVYLCVLHYCSVLYMASFYFTLGVLFDFVQMVAVYAVLAKYVSEKYATPQGKAKWIWS